MHITTFGRAAILGFLLVLLVAITGYAKEDRLNPKEFGVYIKTPKGLVRLLPNIVFNENEVLYVETNNPARFMLKDVQYFVIYGKQDLNVLTINPLLFLKASPLGKGSFIFGKEIPFETKKRGNNLYTIKPKDLMGRGYFALWIEDSAWDFIIE